LQAASPFLNWKEFFFPANCIFSSCLIYYLKGKVENFALYRMAHNTTLISGIWCNWKIFGIHLFQAILNFCFGILAKKHLPSKALVSCHLSLSISWATPGWRSIGAMSIRIDPLGTKLLIIGNVTHIVVAIASETKFNLEFSVE
jgi:hypothetical protein